MQRYDMDAGITRKGEAVAEPEPSADGKWLLYEDVVNDRGERIRGIEDRLKAVNDRVRWQWIFNWVIIGILVTICIQY